MTDVIPASAEAESLRGLLPGRVFLPGDPGYDEARTPWNTSAQLFPAAVAVPVSVAEVQTVVRAAVSAGLRIAPMSTGHAGALLPISPALCSCGSRASPASRSTPKRRSRE
jgi:hypothetical protein